MHSALGIIDSRSGAAYIAIFILFFFSLLEVFEIKVGGLGGWNGPTITCRRRGLFWDLDVAQALMINTTSDQMLQWHNRVCCSTEFFNLCVTRRNASAPIRKPNWISFVGFQSYGKKMKLTVKYVCISKAMNCLSCYLKTWISEAAGGGGVQGGLNTPLCRPLVRIFIFF